MKRNIAYVIIMIAMVSLATSACKGVGSNVIGGSAGDGVVAEDLPQGSDFQLTDVGNPEETDEYLTSYVNPEFEVKIDYPSSWELTEHGTEAAEFFSEDVDLIATFEWLKDDTFESFLGDIDDLMEIPSPFDKTLCATPEEIDEDTLQIECHHYFDYGEGKSFIASVEGLYTKSALGFKVTPFGIKIPEALKDIAVDVARIAGSATIVEPGVSKSDDEPKILPKPAAPVKPVVRNVVGF